MWIHFAFDFLAAAAAAAVTAFVYRWRVHASLRDPQSTYSMGYFGALVVGALVGAYLFGTLALHLAGIRDIGRSILGALAGSIAGVEIFKWRSGIRGSTGLLFVAGFATSCAVGRIGCFLTGLPDNTYGIPTNAPWGWDFGDGIPRHPVQLYESATMFVFLVAALVAMRERKAFFMRNGFYVLAAVYSLQRFAWEFLKPAGAIAGPLNIFHLLCIAIFVYSVTMIMRGANAGDAGT